jgi:hypothetical protein
MNPDPEARRPNMSANATSIQSTSVAGLKSLCGRLMAARSVSLEEMDQALLEGMAEKFARKNMEADISAPIKMPTNPDL